MTRRIGIIAALVVVGAVALASVGEFARGQSSGVTSEEAYAELNTELDKLKRDLQGARSAEAQYSIMKTIDKKLAGFITSYPGTHEATLAQFDAGTVTLQLQEYERSIEYLTNFLDSKGTERDKVAFAHYFLAEALKATGNYDRARREYRIVIVDFPDVNNQLTGYSRQNLKDIDVEAKLAIGGEPLPFEVKSIDGKVLSPERYRGKVLLLDFWATWCRPCIMEMPNVIKIYNKYNEQGFEIVGVSLDRSRSDLDRYLKKNKIEWPQFFDGKYWQNELATQYSVRQIPTTFLIDKQGKIRYKSIRGKQLEVAVEKLLNE